MAVWSGELKSDEEDSGTLGCVGAGDVGKGLADVDMLVDREDTEGRVESVVKAVSPVVTCAKVELGRMHERNTIVEDRGILDFANRHLLLAF